MNRRDYSRKAEQAKEVVRLPLAKLLQNQTFLTLQSEKHDVHQMDIETFDLWADSLCEEITSVNRQVWDAFARWRFINFLISEGIVTMQIEENGTISLMETEEKTSSENTDEPASEAEGA